MCFYVQNDYTFAEINKPGGLPIVSFHVDGIKIDAWRLLIAAMIAIEPVYKRRFDSGSPCLSEQEIFSDLPWRAVLAATVFFCDFFPWDAFSKLAN